LGTRFKSSSTCDGRQFSSVFYFPTFVFKPPFFRSFVNFNVPNLKIVGSRAKIVGSVPDFDGRNLVNECSTLKIECSVAKILRRNLVNDCAKVDFDGFRDFVNKLGLTGGFLRGYFRVEPGQKTSNRKANYG
jgi:hypothetical protein